MSEEELRELCKKRGIEKSPRGIAIADCNKGKMIAALESYDEDDTDE